MEKSAVSAVWAVPAVSMNGQTKGITASLTMGHYALSVENNEGLLYARTFLQK